MSGTCAVAADDRLAAYDFGPGHPFQAGRPETSGLDHPFRAGRLEGGLSLLRAARVLDDGDLLAFGPAADADLELIHDRDYLEALARFSDPEAAAAPLTARPARAGRGRWPGSRRPPGRPPPERR